MDGFMLTVSADERHHLPKKKKQEWRTLFLKLDDISARLIAFSDRSQFQVCWSVQLAGADISTPVPGEPNYGIDVDDTPFCFYVRETSVAKDCVHFFSASGDATKKTWMKALTQIARDGPRAPRFAVSQAENEFEFHARVAKFRPHVDGTHAEFLVTCSCQVFSKLVARRLKKEWGLWRRFSEFDDLNEKLKKLLGPQMEGLGIVKHKRDAFRSVLGKAFDQEFLEERRVLLDSFVAGVCKIRTAVDFFKHHSDPHLKSFFDFDENCQDVEQSPRKAAASRSRSRNTARKREDDAVRASTSSRTDDSDGKTLATSAPGDSTSNGGRNRSKGSRTTTRQSEDETSRASTSSRGSDDRNTHSRSQSRASDATSGEDTSRRHHHHREKHGDASDGKQRRSSKKRDKHPSGKRNPAGSLDEAEMEIRRADPTA